MADTTFHGWTIESDEAGNIVTLTKPHEAGKNGRLLVRSRGGKDTPHAITLATAKRDALAEDLRLAPADERDDATDRHAAAHEKVKRLRADNLAAKGE